jgi:hypothetical protein
MIDGPSDSPRDYKTYRDIIQVTHNMLISCAGEKSTQYLHPVLYLHSYLIVLSDGGSHRMQHSDCMIDEQVVATHLHPMLKLRMIGAVSSLPHMPLWYAQEQFCLYLYDGKLIVL